MLVAAEVGAAVAAISIGLAAVAPTATDAGLCVLRDCWIGCCRRTVQSAAASEKVFVDDTI